MRFALPFLLLAAAAPVNAQSTAQPADSSTRQSSSGPRAIIGVSVNIIAAERISFGKPQQKRSSRTKNMRQHRKRNALQLVEYQ